MVEQTHFIVDNLPNLLVGFPGQRPGGLLLSMALAIVAILLGFLLGNLIGSGATSSRQLVRWLCRCYVDLLRGLPLVLLLLLVYQILGSGRWGFIVTPQVAAIVTLTLYSSAYQAEIIRAGLQSVPLSLIESAQTLGSGPWSRYWLIRLRYAVQTMLPALVGQAISLFKDTSVVIIIGVADLMMAARVVLGSDVKNAPYWVSLYMTVGLLYFCIAFTLSQLVRRWEKRLQMGDLVHSLSTYS